MSVPKRLSLPKHFDVITRTSDVRPSADTVQILRLDDEVLLADPRYQSNPFISFMTPWILIGVGVAAAIAPKLLSSAAGGANFGLITWVGCVLAVGAMFFSVGFVGMTLFSRAPSPILFNRKTRKVYGSHRGVVMELKWKDITPITTSASAVSESGSMTFSNLILVEFEPGQPPSKKTVRKGFTVTTGNLGSGSCVALWEFFRCFMEEAPEKLPPTEVHPSITSWTARFLQQGPYGDFYIGEPLTIPLRERKGIPRIHWYITLPVLLFWVGIPFSLWQAWCRPRAQIPAQWIPPTPVSPNPFNVIVADENDLRLQKRAATLMVLWMMACAGTGAWIYWSVIQWFIHFGH
ncbi:DUF6708 domain-containing protein [Niveibacterium sp.]|uniref:DUF6708 domain-containing protein n=1 Tax=Niveibacterium sp. TaxID=2017444 RepID=UPI0035B3A1B7